MHSKDPSCARIPWRTAFIFAGYPGTQNYTLRLRRQVHIRIISNNMSLSEEALLLSTIAVIEPFRSSLSLLSQILLYFSQGSHERSTVHCRLCELKIEQLSMNVFTYSFTSEQAKLEEHENFPKVPTG